MSFATGTPERDIFTIRDLTKEFGVSARTLRFYEEKGLLDPTRRGEQRLYTRRDRARLAYVLAGRTVGFSLEEVREMLDLYDLGDGQVTQLKVALTKFGERVERLEEEKKAIADDIRDVYAEAKGNGFDVKTLRVVVRLRKQDLNERKEQEAVLHTYLHALGMLS